METGPSKVKSYNKHEKTQLHTKDAWSYSQYCRCDRRVQNTSSEHDASVITN